MKRLKMVPLIMFMMLMALGSFGCKDEPTSDWAKETYPKHKATVDGVRAELTPLFEQFAPLPYTKLDPAKSQEQQEAQTARMNTFDEAAFAALKSHEDLIGWEVTYSFPEVEKPEIPYSFTKLSTFTPSYKGSATVRAGARDIKGDEKYPLGWGMYKVRGKEMRKSLGMEAPRYFKGLEVITTLKHQDAQLKLKLFMVDPQLLKDE